MIAESLINPSILPLRITDTVDLALNWMEELKVSHLPIVKNYNFLGLVEEKYLHDISPDTKLSDTNLEFKKVSCKPQDHIFDIVRIVNEYHTSIISVLDTKENYVGSITNMDLYNWISNTIMFP